MNNKPLEIFRSKTGLDLNLYFLPVVDEDISRNVILDELKGVLVTYGNIRSGLMEDWRKKIYVLADSGGYMLYTGTRGDLKFNPVEVLEWQKKNSDVGIILDLPPVFSRLEGLERTGKSEEVWKRSKSFTLKSIEVARKQKGEFPVLLVLHYKNFDYLLEWYEELLKDNLRYFDGIAVPLGSRTKEEVVEMNSKAFKFLVLSFLLKEKIPYVHFLMEGNLTFWLFLVYVSKYFKFITADSTAAIQWATKWIFIDYWVKELYPVGRRKSGEFKTYCSCSVCEKYRKGLLKKVKYWLFGHAWLAFHNVIVSWWNLLNKDEERFKMKLKKQFMNEKLVERLLELLDIAWEGDFDYVKENLKLLNYEGFRFKDT